MELWKDISGFEGLYQVSSEGRVKSLDRMVRNTASSFRLRRGKVLSPGLTGGNKDGERYYFVLLSSGKARNFYIHRLVASAFIEPVEGKDTIDHINQNKLDNRVSNLRWATRSEQHLNKRHKLSASGHRHIQYDGRGDGSYTVNITRRPLFIRGGTFPTLEEAIQARDTLLTQTNPAYSD